MPHVTVKMYPGRTGNTKQALADAIARDVVSITGCGDDKVSIDIVDVSPDDWPEQVYRPEILARMDALYKKPGYNPL